MTRNKDYISNGTVIFTYLEDDQRIETERDAGSFYSDLLDRLISDVVYDYEDVWANRWIDEAFEHLKKAAGTITLGKLYRSP